MKIRNHIAQMATLLLMAAGLAAADSASAQQQFPFEGPFTPIIASPMYSGRFYFQGGVRFRLLSRFQFTRLDHQILYVEPGVPPFGPNQEGSFGTGTGVPGFPTDPTYVHANPPNVSGFWQYNNGTIDAQNPNTNDGTCWVAGQCNDAWGSDCGNTGGLGHYPADPATCAAGFNIGRFELFDAFGQPNSSTVNTTTRVSFQRLIDGTYPVAGSGEVASRIISAQMGIWKTNDPGHTAFAPSIEAGFQLDDYFDLFWGLSWVYLSDRYSKSEVVPSTLQRRGFRDTYNFYGTAAVGWPGGFTSTGTIVGQEQNNYDIWADGFAGGTYPTRTFYQNSPGEAYDNLEELCFQQADFSLFENRFGGRSWFPLYGMGRFGFNVGMLLSPYSLQTTSARQVVSLGPNVPGFVVEAVSLKRLDWGFNVGGYAGADLELTFGRYFAKGAVDYSYCKDEKITVFKLETLVNPGGLGVTMAAGFHF